MRKTYSIICLALFLCSVLSCSRYELASEADTRMREVRSFTAEWADESLTKTAIQADGTTVLWSKNEEINLFVGTDTARFHSTNTEAAASVTFTGTLPVSAGTGEIWAAYPFNEANTFDGTHITMTISSQQIASVGSFADKFFPAIAKADGMSLKFYNVCGGAVFTVVQEGVRSVTFKSRSGENLVGKMVVGLDENGVPRVESVSDGSDTVVLTPPDHGTFEVGKKYYAVLLPGTLSTGLSVTMHTAYMMATKTLSTETTVHRSLFGRLLAVDNGLVYEVDYEQVEADRRSLYDIFARKVASKGSATDYSPTRALFNMCGDDVLAGGEKYGSFDYLAALNEFRYDSGNEVVTNVFIDYYTAINEFNRILAIYGSPEDATVKKLVAEGRVLRAYLYFMLAAGWGAPPFVDAYDPDFSTTLVFHCTPELQKTQKDFFSWCAQECADVRLLLDERESRSDVQGAYKVTRGFADAMAGKAYLFAKDYDKARTSLKQVIDNGKYNLVSGDRYMDLFHIEGDGCEEKIFELNLEYDPDIPVSEASLRSTGKESRQWNWCSSHFQIAPQSIYTGGVEGWGVIGVPQWFGDMFLATDGHSCRFDATMKHIDDVVYTMQYGNDTDAQPIDVKIASNEVGIKDTENGLYGQSFLLPFKQLVRAKDTNTLYGSDFRLNNYTIMRYAEVLLLYAEACLNVGDAAEAKIYLNKIQERAGSRTVSAAVGMDVVKKEKMCELWLEGCRWLDLVRWNELDRVQQSGQNIPKLFDKLFRTPLDGESVSWEHGTDANSRFYTVVTHEAVDNGQEVGFKANKHELFPIPAKIMEKNPSMTQNAGW